MNPSILILVLLFLFPCFQDNVAAADEVINIRVTDFPPNYYKDENGNWTGLGVELSSIIVKTAGFKTICWALNSPTMTRAPRMPSKASMSAE